jgi:Fe-S-cluster-containing dehydrogenase component
MSKVIVISASKPTFRRAGIGFTENGTAFAPEQLSDEQRSAIEKERFLSVREIDEENIAQSVDTSPLQAFKLQQLEKETAEKVAAANAEEAQKAAQVKAEAAKKAAEAKKKAAAEK